MLQVDRLRCKQLDLWIACGPVRQCRILTSFNLGEYIITPAHLVLPHRRAHGNTTMAKVETTHQTR